MLEGVAEYLKGVKEGDFGRDGPITDGTKLIVTKYALFHWLAQQYNFSIDTIPTKRPQNLPHVVYEQFKEFIKKRQNLVKSKKTKKLSAW